VTEPENTDASPASPSAYLQLAAGLLVFLAASGAALLAAGTLGVAGVVIAALIEAAAISWIYRWCEA
jgi:hypothetical protein